ncbi:uncharacterized protein LOC124898559 [Capsicum annuum]|uniref:uncharacterized protein LOC124898559 n=1 Tax=Capsicum annuum TaxID=4072 RepID=UPI001FB0594B|nr:uncharacterized protein LOC124898559 [Capsicum annuum]
MAKSDFVMVEDDRYEQFSWGKAFFQKLIATWRQDFFVEKQLYSIGEMPYVLNVWMYECCSEFVYTNLWPTHEEVQRLDLPTIEGVELNGYESAFSHDTYLDRSDSEKTPSSVSRKNMPIDQLRISDSERVDAQTLTPSSSGKSGHQDNFDQKWNELKFFLKSYVDQKFTFLHKVMVKQHEESNDRRNKQHAKLTSMLKHIKHTHEKDQQDQDVQCLQKKDVPSKKQDFERFSADIETFTLNAFVEEMVNQESEDIGTATLNALVDIVDEYLSTISESAQLKIDAIMQDLAALVDDIPLEVVKSMDEIINLHSLSYSQIPSHYPDSVFVAHLVTKSPAKLIKTRSRIFKSPYTTDFASCSKALEDESTDFKQKFTFEGYEISDDMPDFVIEEYKK